MSDPKTKETEEAPKFRQPDIDICSECGEHTEFTEDGSDCCGAGWIDTDPDIDMER